MGDRVIANSFGEAYLKGVEIGVQFLIEECNALDEEIGILAYYRNIIDWLKGKKDTDWSLRFLRNKTMNLKGMVQYMEIAFVNEKEFKEKKTWIETAKNMEASWVKWQNLDT
ncbi:hypothetical protein PIB30_032275 [Stylosanthes scabra]|uniref:Uncharacterized protein n=1 Tax=Stylosanthes scabra TaxID=79078 RepID=A0ABU6XCE1_9FABA|nr:hypothetical protein [Stylosanthes scabra]